MPPNRMDVDIDSDDVLTLLEDDQLVAAKAKVRLGRRSFSPGLKAILWALRVYVVLMLVLIAVKVVQAVGAGH